MRAARLTSLVAAGVLAATAALTATPAQAARGTTSLAEVLAADGNRLDRNWNDFDIVEKAVYAVLRAKPNSAVGVLADGNTRLTAFVPTDRAFRRLVFQLAGVRAPNERAVLRAVRSVADADTLETILLYHVVPGAPIKYATARKADGAALTTAQGRRIRVNVLPHQIALRDRDFDAVNPKILKAARNVNKGNRQIAHGISQVLRPIDL